MSGIFIKACSRDHEWLGFCLRSIEKYALGFVGVCILTDSDHTNTHELEGIITKMPLSIVKVPLPQNITHNCQDGIGYIWMQNQKLLWHNYCKFDSVLQIDADCIMIGDVSVEMYRKNGKFNWWVRSWRQSGHAFVHFKPLHKMFKEQPKHEHMLFNGWLIERETTTKFHEWIKAEYDCDLWTYILEHTNEDWGQQLDNLLGRGFSVYNAYGAFMEQKFPDKYNIVEGFVNMPPIRQFWSYNGVSDAIKAEMEIHLGD